MMVTTRTVTPSIVILGSRKTNGLARHTKIRMLACTVGTYDMYVCMRICGRGAERMAESVPTDPK